MCLIVFAWQTHPGYRLILAANRDERHDRPSSELHWWPDAPRLLAGRDLEAGGTWLAVSRDGRFATVTNYRENREPSQATVSRGGIVTDFALGDLAPDAFVASIDGGRYSGVNVLVSDGRSMSYVSNRGDGPTALSPGIYGLSNASLDTPWSKLVRSRDRLGKLVADGEPDFDALSRLLADRTPSTEPEALADGLPDGLARAISAPFIVSPEYGTRSSTVMTWATNGVVRIMETRFDPSGDESGRSIEEFEIDQSPDTP